MPITPPQSSAAESVRARSRSYGSMLQAAENASSFSVWNPSYLDIGEFPRSPLGSTRATSTMSCDGYIGMPPRVPLGPKPGSRLATSNKDPGTNGNRPVKQDNRPEIAYSSESKGRTLPRVSFSSLGTRGKRKKKLVISGIAAGDTRKFEAAKRWCESFGEVSQITRMPNDDLHVHYRNADVADTVRIPRNARQLELTIGLGLSTSREGIYPWRWKRATLLVHWQRNRKQPMNPLSFSPT
ncbi:hypothetical protein C8R44DRAFT_269599 [Mycena epipterygia]|nr:hypothetical protein C8R44DRAFT_269599 [Mycena epipterygia]